MLELEQMTNKPKNAKTTGEALAGPGAKVRAFRQARGESQQIFGKAIGLAKSKVSALENSGLASSAVALEIESLSNFIIDAADLSAGVAKARSGFVRFGQYQAGAALSQAQAAR
jgi:transcriptional regulator with XRE-family HTH domain